MCWLVARFYNHGSSSRRARFTHAHNAVRRDEEAAQWVFEFRFPAFMRKETSSAHIHTCYTFLTKFSSESL